MPLQFRFAMIAVILSGYTATCALPAAGERYECQPDVTSDAYWDSHDICLVNVADIAGDEDGKQEVRFHVVQRFSAPDGADSIAMPEVAICFVDNSKPHSIKVGDNFVAFFVKHEKDIVPVIQVPEDAPNKVVIVRRFRKIARLRAGEGGLDALSEGVFDDDAQVAGYCLKRMQTRSPDDVSAYISRLEQLRDKEEIDATVRLLANDLAHILRKTGIPNETTYRWLKSSITSAHKAEFGQLLPLVDRLVGFDTNRDESADFLARLALDDKQRQDVRWLACHPFDDKRLFIYSKPDAASERIFATCVSLLNDRDPTMRQIAASKLARLCNHMTSHHAEVSICVIYVRRAKEAVLKALATENDKASKISIHRDLNEIKKLAQLLPLKE